MKTTIAMLTLLLAFSGQGFGNDFWDKLRDIEWQQEQAEMERQMAADDNYWQNQDIQDRLEQIAERQQEILDRQRELDSD